ncbi:hypothetical protein [Streptomyces marincola]|uniref:Uncharacterized protein n=1 Tax=Streptomyces marincola TaxID=2878388 RepID=A0A1W7CUK0_9ACTN|nr:hypothetical protein [Streptomyces marincola]ARQ68386.1 hypothetical protein CAG99_05565 [Streptomyces marincola]
MERGALTFEELLHLPLGPLDEAAAEWDTQVRRLGDMKNAADGMRRHTQRANWAGENANVTVPFVRDQAEQFDAAQTQARTFRDLCRDGHRILKYHKDELVELVEVTARELGVHVRASGEVTADLDGLDGDTRRERQDAVTAVSERIRRVLNRAADADAEIARALRSAMGTDPDRFSPVRYETVNEAELAHRDVATVVDLLRRTDLDAGGMTYAAYLLDQYKDDPVFAERLALELGPEGVAEFWAATAANRPLGAEREEWETAAAALQTGLGATLGTATLSETAAMERWERDLVALGDQRIGDATGPYGFQVTSALMRSGEWDSDLLLDYGENLLAFEQGTGRDPSNVWHMVDGTMLNFPSEHDAGLDPVVGFLQALGQSPDAATAFFAAPDDFDPTAAISRKNEEDEERSLREHREMLNDNLFYLASEREWWSREPGAPSDGPVDASLSEALLAAGTGYQAGADPQHAMAQTSTSAESAAVMEQVMHLYGTLDPTLLQQSPELGRNLGIMAGMYIPDINYWASTDSEVQRGLYPDTYESPRGEWLGNGRESTIRFLTTLGQNAEAHEAMTKAQQLYTLDNLDRFPPVDEDSTTKGIDSLRTAATVRGILDFGRVDAIITEYGEESAAAQQRMSQMAGWAKSGTGSFISAGIGAGAGLAAASLSGPAVVIVPVAAGVGGGFLAEYFNQGYDEMFQAEGTSRQEVNDSTSDYHIAGSREVAALRDAYLGSVEEGDVEASDQYMMAEGMEDVYQYGTGLGESHGN